MSKSDIQQTFRTISFIHKSAHVGTVEERVNMAFHVDP